MMEKKILIHAHVDNGLHSLKLHKSHSYRRNIFGNELFSILMLSTRIVMCVMLKYRRRVVVCQHNTIIMQLLDLYVYRRLTLDIHLLHNIIYNRFYLISTYFHNLAYHHSLSIKSCALPLKFVIC